MDLGKPCNALRSDLMTNSREILFEEICVRPTTGVFIAEQDLNSHTHLIAGNYISCDIFCKRQHHPREGSHLRGVGAPWKKREAGYRDQSVGGTGV